MYGYNNMPPPYAPWFGMPQPTGVPQPPPQMPPDPVAVISGWIKGLEELKKAVKEEKKDDDKKKPEKKAPDMSLFAMCLFMLLVSPITGPTMYHFFQQSLNIIK